MQKNFVVEVYSCKGQRTYIVRVPNDQTKGFDVVLVTNNPSDISDYALQL